LSENNSTDGYYHGLLITFPTDTFQYIVHVKRDILLARVTTRLKALVRVTTHLKALVRVTTHLKALVRVFEIATGTMVHGMMSDI
jgi:hypothetical protein